MRWVCLCTCSANLDSWNPALKSGPHLGWNTLLYVSNFVRISALKASKRSDAACASGPIREALLPSSRRNCSLLNASNSVLSTRCLLYAMISPVSSGTIRHVRHPNVRLLLSMSAYMWSPTYSSLSPAVICSSLWSIWALPPYYSEIIAHSRGWNGGERGWEGEERRGGEKEVREGEKKEGEGSMVIHTSVYKIFLSSLTKIPKSDVLERTFLLLGMLLQLQEWTV